MATSSNAKSPDIWIDDYHWQHDLRDPPVILSFKNFPAWMNNGQKWKAQSICKGLQMNLGQRKLGREMNAVKQVKVDTEAGNENSLQGNITVSSRSVGSTVAIVLSEMYPDVKVSVVESMPRWVVEVTEEYANGKLVSEPPQHYPPVLLPGAPAYSSADHPLIPQPVDSSSAAPVPRSERLYCGGYLVITPAIVDAVMAPSESREGKGKEAEKQ